MNADRVTLYGFRYFFELPGNLLIDKLRDDLPCYRWGKFRGLKISKNKLKIIEDETSKKFIGLRGYD